MKRLWAFAGFSSSPPATDRIDMAEKTNWDDFARVYNDELQYPSLRSVGVALGISLKTVRNKSAICRSLKAIGANVPELALRLPNPDDAIPDNDPEDTPEVTPYEHAHKRAQGLRGEIEALLTCSRYPVTNPQSVIVESFVSQRYSRGTQQYEDSEGAPRTWLSETLRVAPVKNPAGLRFLFTGAQNDCALHEDFWTNLKAYADFIDAEIVVGPWTYETQWWNESNPNSRAYAKELKEHLCFGQFALGDKFVFCGEMNTLPTAAQPISDLVTYSRGRWAVFPHAKLQLKSVPSTDPNVQAHQVMTTGACTKPKVIPRKAGVKSIFHHVIGATIVEFDEDGDLFCRQISATEDGSFYDLDHFVADGTVTGGQTIKALVCGDIHVRKLDPINAEATFFKSGSILDTLRPDLVFLHDVHDNEARNHHNQDDNAHAYEMAIRKRDSVFEEVRAGADFIAAIQRPFAQVKVVESNHDLALERYVREGRYRMDGINIRYGMQLEDAYLGWRERVAHALDHRQKPPSFSLLEYAMRNAQRVPGSIDHASWVYDGTSCLVDGIECGHHGFRGANGSKGTVTGYARMGCKMSIGDKHSPEILDGVYGAGVMALAHGYNKGPSGWCVSHIVQYRNGKRTIITLQKGKWRAGPDPYPHAVLGGALVSQY